MQQPAASQEFSSSQQQRASDISRTERMKDRKEEQVKVTNNVLSCSDTCYVSFQVTAIQNTQATVKITRGHLSLINGMQSYTIKRASNYFVILF